jgi:hypothetical protein
MSSAGLGTKKSVLEGDRSNLPDQTSNNRSKCGSFPRIREMTSLFSRSKYFSYRQSNEETNWLELDHMRGLKCLKALQRYFLTD